MAKTNNKAGFIGLQRGSAKGGKSAPFAGSLKAGRATASALPKRSGKNTSGTAGAGPGGDLVGGKSPHGKTLKVS